MKHPNDKGYGICPVCFSGLLKSTGLTGGDYYDLKCPRCGSFKISRTAAQVFQTSERLGEEGGRERANLSAWLREKQPQEMLSTVFLNTEEPDVLGAEFWATPEPTFHQKADKLLKAFRERTEFAGQLIDWWADKGVYWARSWSRNDEELLELVEYLISQSRISGGATVSESLGGVKNHDIRGVRIRPDGWAHLERITIDLPHTDQGFMAMWFNPETDKAWATAFIPAIELAGYYPQRIDMKQHNNKIDDEIIAEIRKSKFLVADLTAHRGGVYYEAGFAQGLGLPVIWTCRADGFEELHFDIRQYACIKWEETELEGLKKALKNRIEATLGRGNYKPRMG